MMRREETEQRAGEPAFIQDLAVRSLNIPVPRCHITMFPAEAPRRALAFGDTAKRTSPGTDSEASSGGTDSRAQLVSQLGRAAHGPLARPCAKPHIHVSGVVHCPRLHASRHGSFFSLTGKEIPLFCWFQLIRQGQCDYGICWLAEFFLHVPPCQCGWGTVPLIPTDFRAVGDPCLAVKAALKCSNPDV